MAFTTEHCRLALSVTLVMIMYSCAIEVSSSLELKSATREEIISSKSFYSEFRDFEAIIERLKYLNSSGEAGPLLKYPPRLQTIGTTEQGREIVLARLGNPEAPRKILINALQHAREWLSGMVAMRLIEVSGEGIEFGSELDNIELLVIPVVNPDGFEYTKIDRFWRKNREIVPGSRCVGVDLNRNWGFQFSGRGASASPCSLIYHGSEAFSTKETAALKKLVDEEGPEKLVFHLDVHTFAALVLGPWAFTNRAAPFSNKTNAVGKRFTRDLRRNAVCPKRDPNCGDFYQYGTGGFLLGLAAGVFPDYTYSLGIMSYTLELRPGDIFGPQGFDPPANSIVQSSDTVNAAFRRILCLADQRPEVFDLSPGTPDVAPDSLDCDLDLEVSTSPSPDFESVFDE